MQSTTFLQHVGSSALSRRLLCQSARAPPILLGSSIQHTMSTGICPRCGRDLMFLLADGTSVCLNGKCSYNRPVVHHVLARIKNSLQPHDESEDDKSSSDAHHNWSPKLAADLLLATRAKMGDPIQCTAATQVKSKKRRLHRV